MATRRAGRPLLMLIDDSEDDRTLVRLALAELPQPPEVLEVQNGKEALAVLASAAELPSVILLDLQMPIMNGFGFLERLRTDDGLRKVPVVVFSTSGAAWDVDESYRLGANAYLVKPVGMPDTIATLEELLGVFLRLVELPQPRRLPAA